MPWIKLDQDFPDHPKIVRAGPIGMVIYIRGLCYASRYLTDGFIPDAVADKITGDLDEYGEHEVDTQEIIWWSLMTQVGLWKKVKGGFKIHNYLKYNQSARDVRKMLKQKAEAGKQGGIAKAKHRASRSPRKVSSKSLPDTDTDIDTDLTTPYIPQCEDCKKIIDHLNAKSGRNYRAEGKSAGYVHARHETHGVDACLQVVDRKVAAWLHSPKWSKYLRPETLFNATKFDGYVNEDMPQEDNLPGIDEDWETRR